MATIERWCDVCGDNTQALAFLKCCPFCKTVYPIELIVRDVVPEHVDDPMDRDSMLLAKDSEIDGTNHV